VGGFGLRVEREEELQCAEKELISERDISYG
jgi:hypothetical protein